MSWTLLNGDFKVNTYKSHQYVVVGGGIIGLCIALTLQDAGQQVTLIDKERIASGASWGNAGHLATEQVFPLAEVKMLTSIPSMLLNPLGPLRLDWRYLHKISPWLMQLLFNIRPSAQQKTHQALRSINQLSIDAWREIANRWNLMKWINIEGSLLVTQQPKTMQSLKQKGDYLNSIGVKNQWLNDEQIQELAPGLSPHLGGLFYPETGHISNLEAVSQTLKKQFTLLGGEIIENCEIIKAKRNIDNLIELHSNKTVFLTKKVVLSAGAYSKKLCYQLTNTKVPLETERGYHMMLPHEGHRLKIPVTSADSYFIMTPMSSGLRLAGTVEYAGLNLPPNMQRAKAFIPLAEHMFRSTLNLDDATPWMGFRPTLPDSLPIIDKVDNVYLAFGHQHLGLTHAAITAKAILSLHLNKESPFDLSPYKLNRFS